MFLKFVTGLLPTAEEKKIDQACDAYFELDISIPFLNDSVKLERDGTLSLNRTQKDHHKEL